MVEYGLLLGRGVEAAWEARQYAAETGLSDGGAEEAVVLAWEEMGMGSQDEGTRCEGKRRQVGVKEASKERERGKKGAKKGQKGKENHHAPSKATTCA